MARTNNLTNFLTDVAGAIKTKKGSQTAIQASNFDTEILNLPSQGTYQQKAVTISSNTVTTVIPDSGYDAIDELTVTTQVPEKQLQTKSYTFTQNTNIQLSPETGYDGFDKVNLSIDVEDPEYDENLALSEHILENKGYTRLQYIDSTGDQFINTGLYAQYATQIEMKVDRLECSTTSGLFGAWNDTTGYCIMAEVHQSKWSLFHENTSTNLMQHITASDGIKTLYINRTQMGIRDESGILESFMDYSESGSFWSTSSYTMYLFARNHNGSPENKCAIRFYGCKIYNGTTLMRDFIPVLDYEGVPCLYDRVENKFYHRSGTGSFIAGPEFIPYVELQYIEGTGTQWIDTGVHPSNRISAQITFVDAGGGDFTIGAFDGSETKSFRLFGTGEDVYSTRDRWYLDYGSGENYNRINSQSGTFYQNTVYSVEFGNRYIKYYPSEETIISSTEIGSFEYSDMNIGIFSCTSRPTSIKSGKIYDCKIYRDGVPILDLIPVINNDNNETCMYDRISQTFFSNAGTGSFIAGPSYLSY